MSAVSYVSKVRDSVREKVNKWHSTKLDPGFNEDLKGPDINRRQVLGIVASSVTTGAAGCQDIMRGDDPKTTVQPTDEPTETPESTATPEPTQTPSEIERLESENEELRELKDKLEDDNDGERYEQVTETLIGEDGYGENDKETVRYLNQMREDLSQDAFDTTTSTIAELEEFEDTHWKTIETWMESDLNEFNGFRKEAFETGFTDTDGDGIAEGLAGYIGMNEGEEYDKLAPVVQTLAENVENGFNDQQIRYLTRLRVLADGDYENPDDVLNIDNSSNVSYWNQADALNLLQQLAENPEKIDKDTIYKLEAVEGDTMIRGMKQELGLDPEKVDSTGDGVPDGFGALTDIFTDVTYDPSKKNSMMQISKVGNANLDDAWETVQPEFPLQIQKNQKHTGLDQPESLDELDAIINENFDLEESGHFMLLETEDYFTTENDININFALQYERLEEGKPVAGMISAKSSIGKEALDHLLAMQLLTMHGYLPFDFRDNPVEDDPGTMNRNTDYEDEVKIADESIEVMKDNGWLGAFRNYSDIAEQIPGGEGNPWIDYVNEHGDSQADVDQDLERIEPANFKTDGGNYLPEGDAEARGNVYDPLDLIGIEEDAEDIPDPEEQEEGHLYKINTADIDQTSTDLTDTPLEVGVMNGEKWVYTRAGEV